MYEEAESNANGFGRFAIAEAHKYMRPMSLHLDILRRNTFR